MKFLCAFLLLLFSMSFYGFPQSMDDATSWAEVLKNRRGTIVFYWHPSHPFIYEEKNEIVGIEYELANSLLEFIENQYDVELTEKWVKASKFDDVVENMPNYGSGVFGVSSISITPERAQKFSFTPPYMSDISVIISSPDIPIAHTEEEFKKAISGLKAISIPHTTFETRLLSLKKELQIEYDIVSIHSREDVVKKLESMTEAFAYIDLPSLLLSMSDNSSVRRQFFYPDKLYGLSFSYPLDSDWDEPTNLYFNSEQFSIDKKRILSKHLGDDVTELMNTIAKSVEMGPYEEIIILTKEKEYQYKELLETTLKAQQDQKIRNILIGGVILVVIMASIYYGRYRLKTKANLALKNKQEQIEQKNQQLIELNEQKNNLINVLAHDLRSPINQILGLAQMYIRENKDMNDDQKMIIQYIEDSSNKLKILIGKILDVEAIETQSLNLKMEKLDFNELIENVVSNYKEMAKAKNIDLKKLYTKTSSLVSGDRVYLTQVVDNLLSNALKFSEKNTTVAVDIKESSEQVTLSVADQGPGFTDEDKQYLFKKFQQLSAKPTAGEHSTGLGLSIIKMYIDLMKGSISVDSEVGKGTTFFVNFNKAL